ncbi:MULTISPECIES: peptide chain release factor N(5)-glutamine methyltransferase [unclassified Candidatus Frackibacter]|uniref:peptide chain release factor N(5)-glutamine methyltransferase n=1 Tax=unclassified Candidatus Frackibacter TaxID=2648818 RepID=UPI000794523C|nr:MULTISPECIES: peptide chain release factor N(5)-glutamine methyltransferase [unclassified Candidatus Frackibacter]KXS45718.1 MAG: release factor glutamine methyltransferase [Candidatus Frackibacter sp. T328-2]SDC10842.1 release factor glutamine methyltransferase [Candidatus Frackibacter sp. WG11]SEM36880.1 release factor glutamine methyltransferase [Candidatus Frackibacter sp. WG12]SFL42263.1 release factor glutamine methyltransferase [Candidatus Frackibacter sp. WG13]
MEKLDIKEILNRTTEHFKKYDIATPRLDAEVLLADLIGVERIQLYVQFNRPLTKEEIDEYRERVIKRSKRVPVAYIIGQQEFMSLDFKVTQDVLIPRPETEHLVERTIQEVKESDKEELTVLDLCTGSGAIIISLVKELISGMEIKVRYIAVDISEEALKVAKENARLHGVLDKIEFIKGDLLEPIVKKGLQIDILVSNPPYVPNQDLDELQPELQYEPEIALKGGQDGLDFYKRIITGAQKVITDSGIIALEIGNQQLLGVKDLLVKNDFSDIEIIDDYSEVPRVILGKNNNERSD